MGGLKWILNELTKHPFCTNSLYFAVIWAKVKTNYI